MKTFGLLLLSILLSQGPQTQRGTLRGTVIDITTKKPIQNVSIQMLNSKLRTKTDPNGEFSFESIPVGIYDFRVSSEDYATILYRGFSVRPDSVLTINVPLFKGSSNYKPRIKIVPPDSSIDFKMRYMRIPKQNNQDPP